MLYADIINIIYDYHNSMEHYDKYKNVLRHIERKNQNRFSQDIYTMGNIDSRDRGNLLYGKQNNYIIKLRRTFKAVTVVKLKSSEFPNNGI